MIPNIPKLVQLHFSRYATRPKDTVQCKIYFETVDTMALFLRKDGPLKCC